MRRKQWGAICIVAGAMCAIANGVMLPSLPQAGLLLLFGLLLFVTGLGLVGLWDRTEDDLTEGTCPACRQHPITHYCRVCDDWLCDPCWKTHRRWVCELKD